MYACKLQSLTKFEDLQDGAKKKIYVWGQPDSDSYGSSLEV